MLRLTEGVRDIQATLDSDVITPQLQASFDEALGLMCGWRCWIVRLWAASTWRLTEVVMLLDGWAFADEALCKSPVRHQPGLESRCAVQP